MHSEHFFPFIFLLFTFLFGLSVSKLLTLVIYLSFSMKVKSSNGTNEMQTTEVTVSQYFANHHGLELKYSACLPCLDVGKPKKPNYVPLEVFKLLVPNILLCVCVYSVHTYAYIIFLM